MELDLYCYVYFISLEKRNVLITLTRQIPIQILSLNFFIRINKSTKIDVSDS